MSKLSATLFLFLWLLLGGLVAALSLTTGSVKLSWQETAEILLGNPHPYSQIIWEIRLPRLLLVWISGATLSLGGLLMQTLVRNPLADPYIMGLTAGAGLGVNVWAGLSAGLGVSFLYAQPLAAGLGAMLSLLGVFVLAGGGIRGRSHSLLLAGVAVSSLFTALTGFLIYKVYTDSYLRKMVFWTMGSFETANLTMAGIAAVGLLLLCLYVWLSALHLDLLQMGEQQAQTLGLPVGRFKLELLLILSFCVGLVVAFTGPIGFVGMMIPHFSRKIWGGLHKNLLLPTLLVGAVYLSFADWLGHFLLPPVGLPIGIVTALLGVPFFLYVIRGVR